MHCCLFTRTLSSECRKGEQGEHTDLHTRCDHWQLHVARCQTEPLADSLLLPDHQQTAFCRNGEQDEETEDDTSIQEAQASINKAQQVLHLNLPVGDPDHGPGVSANSALGTAAGIAKAASPLVALPDWVCMPSNAAQNWVRYTAWGLVSGWSASLLCRCTAAAHISAQPL